MNGRFDVTMIDNRGKDDQYFQDAIDGGYIMDALGDLPIVGHCPEKHNQNRIFDNMAMGILHNNFQAPNPSGNWQYLVNDAAHALLSFIRLSTTSSTTTSYTEDLIYYGYYNLNDSAMADRASSSGGKRFYEDDITAPTIWSDTAREAVHFRNRFLYLPSQGNSSNIKSVDIWAQQDGDTTNDNYKAIGKIGRVRLRDANGVLTTLNKTSSNSLLIEYTFTLVTW